MKLNWITAHRRLLKLVWPFVLTVALQVALGVFSLNILSAVRAYVGGESLWSKGQKDAIYALYRYADSGHPADLVQYQQALGSLPETGAHARRWSKPNPIPMLPAKDFWRAAMRRATSIT